MTGDRHLVRIAVRAAAAAERFQDEVGDQPSEPGRGQAVDRGRRPPVPPVAASSAALASHSFEWSAACDGRRNARSSVGVGVAAIAA